MQQLRGAGLDPWQFNPWKQRCSGLLGLRAHRAWITRLLGAARAARRPAAGARRRRRVPPRAERHL